MNQIAKDETLKLALEALEGVVKNCWRDIPSWRLNEIERQIAAIKQSLAGHVQERTVFKHYPEYSDCTTGGSR